MTQIRHNYDYGSTYHQALRINWQIEDIIGGDKTLDLWNVIWWARRRLVCRWQAVAV